MKRLVGFTVLVFTAWATAADKPYDFRASEAYRQLSATDRQRLEQVRRDEILLWGALDMFADEHGGKPAKTLEELVPCYLAELPSDPFAVGGAAKERRLAGYQSSKGGSGYWYMRGAGYKRGAADNRAWVIASIGLPDFPYLAERGNVGLYVCKGTWGSGGFNPVAGSKFKARDAPTKDAPATPASTSNGSGPRPP